MITEIYVLVMLFFNATSVATHSVPGFVSIESCEREGKRAQALVANTAKRYSFVCLKQEFKTDTEHD